MVNLWCRQGPGGEALLTVAALCLERGGRELFRDLSFTVRPGQLVQIEGANGAGKTSLLRILAGLSRYGYSGSVARHCPQLYTGAPERGQGAALRRAKTSPGTWPANPPTAGCRLTRRWRRWACTATRMSPVTPCQPGSTAGEPGAAVSSQCPCGCWMNPLPRSTRAG